jgi:hypothetical protein
MSLSVKLDWRRKEDIEEFQASLILGEGLKVTFQKALGLMVDLLAGEQGADCQAAKAAPALADDPGWKIRKRPDDWEVDDASEKVDERLQRAR